jgi:hypothetical protein
MEEQDLKNIWRNAYRQDGITIETEQLAKELNAKLEGLHQKVRYRDLREILASVAGILVFGYLLVEIPFPITKLACALGIAWFVFIIVKFRKSQLQAPVDVSATLIERLVQEKAAVMHQFRLLDSALDSTFCDELCIHPWRRKPCKL